MDELIIKPESLPDTIDDLHRFILIAPEKLKSVRAEINAINKAGLAKEVRDQKLQEGQCIGEAILWAEVKLGGMLKSSSKGTFKKGGEKSLPEGIDKKTSHKAQLLADNPEIIKEVIEEARKNDDLPSKSYALQIISQKNKTHNAIQKHKDMKLPKGEYNIILADPPWRYEYSISDSRKIENQYPTMELKDICNINISLLCAEDSVLFLWATNPKLSEALSVIESWGFIYRTNLVWVKDKIGMGYYFRQQHELLLLAVKGKPTTPLPNTRVSSVYNSPRVKHSKKPDGIHDLIETLYPNGSYLEMFARTKREGWEEWGNEIS